MNEFKKLQAIKTPLKGEKNELRGKRYKDPWKFWKSIPFPDTFTPDLQVVVINFVFSISCFLLFCFIFLS